MEDLRSNLRNQLDRELEARLEVEDGEPTTSYRWVQLELPDLKLVDDGAWLKRISARRWNAFKDLFESST